MSAAVQLATAYVSLVVDAKNVASGVAKELTGIEKAASATGEKSGSIFAREFGSKAKPDTKQLEAALDSAKQKAEAASKTVVAARQRQEDADRKAAIAEKAYAEAVERSGEGSSKALAAQDRMILAKRKAEAASHGLKAAEQAEEHAAREVAAAQQRVGATAQQSGQQVSGFGHKVRNALQQGIGHVNPFSGLSRKAAAEGSESGHAFSAKFKGGISGIGAGIGKLIGPAIAAVGVAEVGRGMADIVNKAGQLEQSVGAIDSVFKESAGQMHAWADSAATSVGLSKNEFNELGTLIGAQLKNGGTAMAVSMKSGLEGRNNGSPRKAALARDFTSTCELSAPPGPIKPLC